MKMRENYDRVCACMCASLHVSVNVPTGITSKVIRTAERDSHPGVIGQTTYAGD